MPVYSGKKKSKAHSTLIKDAVPVVQLAQRLSEVSKISCGVITPTRSREETWLKIAHEAACLRITVHGQASVQILRLYCKQLDLLEKELRSSFTVR